MSAVADQDLGGVAAGDDDPGVDTGGRELLGNEVLPPGDELPRRGGDESGTYQVPVHDMQGVQSRSAQAGFEGADAQSGLGLLGAVDRNDNTKVPGSLVQFSGVENRHGTDSPLKAGSADGSEGEAGNNAAATGSDCDDVVARRPAHQFFGGVTAAQDDAGVGPGDCRACDVECEIDRGGAGGGVPVGMRLDDHDVEGILPES